MNFRNSRRVLAPAIKMTLEALERRQFLSAATLDESFGNHGIVQGPPGFLSDMVVQTDRKIIVSKGDAILRYNANGTLDSSFSGDGRLDVPAGAIALQADGKIIAAGGT